MRISDWSSDVCSSDLSFARERKPYPFPCPDGVDPIDWDGLKSNRKAKRASLSEGAHRQIVNKLDRWNRDGWPPGPIVACAAERGWTTVFATDEMKGPANGKSNRKRTRLNSSNSSASRIPSTGCKKK